MNDWLRVTTIGGDDYECRIVFVRIRQYYRR